MPIFRIRALKPTKGRLVMEFNWVFYAIALFVAGGTYFFTAITNFVKLDQPIRQNPSLVPLETKSL
jgi:hypothetical protein